MAKNEGSPVPKEIKLLRGTGNQTRERRKGELTIPEDPDSELTEEERINVPLAPDDLSEAAKELWGRVGLTLASVKLFSPGVYEYLHTYCRLYDQRELAWQDLQLEGRYVVEGEKVAVLENGDLIRSGGVKRISQSMRLFNELTTQIMAVGAKLVVLNPLDKTKGSSLTINKTADKNAQKVPFN